MKKIFLAALLLMASPAFATLDRIYAPLNTAQLTASVTSSSVTFTDKGSIDADTVMFVNEGSNYVYWNAGQSTCTATVPTGTPGVGRTPIPPGGVVTFYKGQGVPIICVVTGTSTSIIDITPGTGL